MYVHANGTPRLCVMFAILCVLLAISMAVYGWQIDSLSEPMTGLTAMNETNTTFLVFGGFYANGTASDTVYRFTWNVSANTLTHEEVTNMRLPEPISPACLIGQPLRPFLIGGQYANGTNSTASYWWNGTTWNRQASLPYHATGAACSYDPIGVHPWVAQSIPTFHGIMRYNVSADHWTAQSYSPMEHPLYAPPTFDEGLLVISGKRTTNDTFVNHGFYNLWPFNVTVRIEYAGFENFTQLETMSLIHSGSYGSASIAIGYGSKKRQYPYILQDDAVTGGNPRMPTNRRTFAGVALLDPSNVSNILVATVGGETFNNQASAAVEVFLAAERRWISSEPSSFTEGKDELIVAPVTAAALVLLLLAVIVFL